MVKKSVILFFLNLLIILAFGEFGSANNHCTASDVRFNNAQGLYLYSEELIYIADTDNHAIRRYNLTSGSVETIAGGGGNHGNGQGNGITGSSGSPLPTGSWSSKPSSTPSKYSTSLFP